MSSVRSTLGNLAALTGLLISTFALSACSEAPEAPVIIGTNIWPGYEPGYLAEQRKLYGEADVSLRQFRSATEALRAFRNQSIDVAAVTLDEALMLAHSGIALQLILVTDISNGGDAIMARPDIASVKGLAGKRVGVENSALGDYVLGRAMQLNGLDDAEFQQITLTADETVELYRRKEIVAVVTFEPFKSRLAALGAKKIFDSTEIPNEIVDVLVVRSEFAKANPNALKAVVAGWIAATELINRRDPAALAQVAKRLELSTDELRTVLQQLKLPSLAENRTLLTASTGPLAEAGRKMVPMLEQRNRIHLETNPADLLTSAFLPEAEAQ